MSDRPAWGEPQQPGDGDPPPDDAPSLPPPPGEPPADPNTVAIERAGLSEESADWLRQVAAQVEPRLDRLAPDWRSSPQAPAARACAFGLLLGHLARTYPHARQDLSRTAEAHPSYSTLSEGRRLETMEDISADPQRMAAWLGALIDVNDPERMRGLLD